MRQARRSMSAMLVVAALAATACGSRLSDEQLQVAIASGAGAAGGGAAAGAGADDAGGGVAAGAGTAGTGTTDATVGTDTGTGTAAGGGTATAGGGDAGTATGGDTGTTAGGDTGTSTGTATADTRAAPPGGNGGATDIGVTADEIVIYNVADISGAVPGIFQDAQLATQAYFAYFAATEGTVYGRQIRLVVRDSQLNASRNRSHYQDACKEAFAAVGSMSAFDEGVAGAVAECGIPDIRAAITNSASHAVPSIFAADVTDPVLYPSNQFRFWDEECPGAKDRSGMLYINNETTTQQTRQVRAITEKLGYVWVVDEAIGLAETNYSSFVIKLKNEDVQYVFFQGDVPQVVRLAQAMRQQNYWPCIFALQQNIYQPKLIQQGGRDVEGVEIAGGTVMVEHIDRHPELQTYREWLKRVSPNAEPTGMGMYSWGASMLFVEAVKAIGPNLTRDALIEYLNGVRGFDGNGLFPPQDIGTDTPANCHLMIRVENQQFVQIDPTDGTDFGCRGEVVAAN